MWPLTPAFPAAPVSRPQNASARFDLSQLSLSLDDGETLEPPDWIKKMTEQFDLSPSSRRAAEKAWANAARLDGAAGTRQP